MQSIALSLTVDRPIREAQDQVLGQVGPLLRTGYTARRAGKSVEYRPKFVGLPLFWVVRRIQGDRVTFTFEPRDSATEVRVVGRLRIRRHAELAEAHGEAKLSS
jgi:hypothetical protein